MDEGKLKELAKESVDLIKEYGNILKLLTDGEDLIESVSIVNCDKSIAVKELTVDEEDIYELSEISLALKTKMMFGRLHDIFNMEIQECIDSFNELNKDEFIDRIGNLYYGQLGCLKIYKRLQEIEKEVCA